MSKEDVLLFGNYGMRGTGKSYYEKLKEKDKEIERLNKEIKRLNNELENVKAHYETEAEAKYYEFIDNHESKLQQRIDKAIALLTLYEVDRLGNEYVQTTQIIEILKGEDNE